MNNKYKGDILPIGHIKMRSLFANFNAVSSFIWEKDFDVMYLSETWLNEYIIDQDNFKCYRCDRIDRGSLSFRIKELKWTLISNTMV